MGKALFLDRDGVINEEKDGSYIFTKEEFHFYDGALAAIVQLKKCFDYIFVVTNQRGIGRKLMTVADLNLIHDFLIEQVKNAGGKIDKIYFAPGMDNDHPLRKPNTGMGLAAQQDFPDIDFSESVMVGNNLSDMKFGKSLTMKTVFLHTTKDKILLPHVLVDEQYESLAAFAEQMRSVSE